MTTYTVESILKSLGYADPLTAASQQARMLLLGRLSRYQAAVSNLESKWKMSFAEMDARYKETHAEDFELDDAYTDWQWYLEAIESIHLQLKVLATS